MFGGDTRRSRRRSPTSRPTAAARSASPASPRAARGDPRLRRGRRRRSAASPAARARSASDWLADAVATASIRWVLADERRRRPAHDGRTGSTTAMAAVAATCTRGRRDGVTLYDCAGAARPSPRTAAGAKLLAALGWPPAAHPPRERRVFALHGQEFDARVRSGWECSSARGRSRNGAIRPRSDWSSWRVGPDRRGATRPPPLPRREAVKVTRSSPGGCRRAVRRVNRERVAHVRERQRRRVGEQPRPPRRHQCFRRPIFIRPHPG